MCDAAVTVVRANVAGPGYVMCSELPLPAAVIASLESALPYWRAEGNAPPVQATRGQLPGAYSHFSVGTYWPELKDQYGRQGLFFWISRVYPSPDLAQYQTDIEAAFEVTRNAIDWLRVPLQLLAKNGGDCAVLIEDLTMRIETGRHLPVLPAETSPESLTEEFVSASAAEECSHEDSSNDLTTRRRRRSLATLLIIIIVAIVIAIRSRPREQKTSPKPPQFSLLRATRHTAAQQVAQETFAIVATKNLYVRSRPSGDSEIVTTVHDGDPLKIIERKDGWIGTEVRGQRGWVSISYVKMPLK